MSEPVYPLQNSPTLPKTQTRKTIPRPMAIMSMLWIYRLRLFASQLDFHSFCILWLLLEAKTAILMEMRFIVRETLTT
jgi:hypothetical protein